MYRAVATAAGDIDSDDTPNPASTSAINGSAADSPQTPTGVPDFVPAAATRATSSSTAGCHGFSRSASSPRSRSAAIVYWARSLVPIDTKSTTSTICSARTAADGTSIITPTVLIPAARA